MLGVIFGECHIKAPYAECHYIHCYCAAYRGAKARAHPSDASLKCCPPDLTYKHETRLEGLARDKHS